MAARYTITIMAKAVTYQPSRSSAMAPRWKTARSGVMPCRMPAKAAVSRVLAVIGSATVKKFASTWPSSSCPRVTGRLW